jgi:elongation factor Ts
MAISMEEIKKLREMSSVGFADCKLALEEAGGDMQKAFELLRKKGIAKLEKRADKTTNAGFIGTYVHNGTLLGAVVIHTETDFATESEDFKTFAKDLAMQVAAQNPTYISRNEVPEDVVAKEKSIYAEEIKKQGGNKPEAIIEKISLGKLDNYYSQVCLMDQAFIKDESKKIQDYLNQVVSKIGEKIVVAKIYRITL